MDPSFYDEDYYLNGVKTGKSSYDNYHWLPDATLPLADHLKRILHIKDRDTVLDFGCARGYVVKALRMRGVNAFGYDSSQWAVENCDEGVKSYVSSMLSEDRFDHILAKDVFEHIYPADLVPLLYKLQSLMRKSMLIIVPLTEEVDGMYLRPADNADPSHVIRWPMSHWMNFIHRMIHIDPDVLVTFSWHYPNLKPASATIPRSCGFIQFTRV